MERTPEPELMNGADQAEAYARADFDDPNCLFVDTFASAFPDYDGDMIYDLGCGPADIPIRLACRYPRARITAMDGAPRMLEHAVTAVARAQLTDRITLRLQRFDDGPLPSPLRGAADAVVSNSLLHHLADPMVLWHWVTGCARPGAAVLVMDLLRPDSECAARGIVDTYGGAEPELLRQDFYASLLAAYRLEEVCAQLRAAALNDFSVIQISDRHLCVQSRMADA